MALLNVKKHIVNSLGEEEELNIYTTISEATNNGLYKSLKIKTSDGVLIGYIGITEDLDTPKASSKRVMIGGKEYAERKYMGIRSMNMYMSKTYSDIWQTLTDITKDMLPEDTSDCTNFYHCFSLCENAATIAEIDTRNSTNFSGFFKSCRKLSYPPHVNCEKATTISAMFMYSGAIEIQELNTVLCTNFSDSFRGCNNLIKVHGVDFSQAQDSELTGISVTTMFSYSPALRSITFNNLPVGTTEATLISKCSIPSTVTEIIMNYREV